jgi:hypothetical protein
VRNYFRQFIIFNVYSDRSPSPKGILFLEENKYASYKRSSQENNIKDPDLSSFPPNEFPYGRHFDMDALIMVAKKLEL